MGSAPVSNLLTSHQNLIEPGSVGIPKIFLPFDLTLVNQELAV